MENRFARELPEMAVAWQAEQAPDPSLLVLNEPVAEQLGLDPEWLRSPDGVQFLVGAGAENAVAQAYAGHQFGGYSPRLGDGRALLLGEYNGLDLHLKGSGRTPFARGGDGRAVIGPMLREYVISEAMHALGIPTTRSLAVVATGRTVQRETGLPGAILARTASSHLRVGSFQYARATGNPDLLKRLADHAIARHYPGLAGDYAGFFDAVVSAQATLIAKWMLAGFVHGVMNTDNMTISGETIDYGPCAFLEAYDPATVYSSIDQGGRYAYGNQPLIAQWNLARLAESLLPLLNDDTDAAIEALKKFGPQYSAAWSAGMAAKLGVTSADDLVDDLLRLMQESRVDHTSFYRALALSIHDDDPVRRLFLDFSDEGGLQSWLARWRALGPDAGAMNRVNPLYIPRNHLVEEALAAATDGDLKAFEQLVDAVSSPYDERPGLEKYATPAPPDFGAYQTFCGT